MKVCDLMLKDPLVLYPDTTLQEAARLLVEEQSPAAPVVSSSDGSLMGLICNKYIVRAVADGINVNSRVGNYMLNDPVTMKPDENIGVFDIAEEIGIIPVIGENQKLMGIVRKYDLLNYCYKELRAIIASIDSPIITIDSNKNIQIINPAAEKLLNKKGSEVTGKCYFDYIPNGQLPNILDDEEMRRIQRFEYNGMEFISHLIPVRVEGAVTGAVCILQDMNDVSGVMKELRTATELKEELNAIIQSSFDGIFVTDGEGRVIYANDAYSRITGIELEVVKGRTMRELVEAGVYNQSVSMQVQERLEAITLTQEINTGKTALVTGNPIFDRKGNLFRIVTNVRDITELYNLKQDYEYARGLNLHLQEQLQKAEGCENFIIKSPKSKELLEQVLRVGRADSTVLIQGESGVGKEMIANLLHSNSLRKDKPYVRINCGAIPDNLLESELFGYEAGAFTGAQKNGKIGFFQLANGGTIFLDEIGELPLELQVKLLRAFQEREITRVGGTKPIKIDVRIIAATNRNLWDMVANGTFRKDLFYRLNVIPLYVHPLRERREEIPELIYSFIKKLNDRYGLNKVIDGSIVECLINYDWPGNVRELENVIERSYVTSAGNVINDVRIDAQCCCQQEKDNHSPALPIKFNLKDAVGKYEKQLILNALKQCKSTRKAALLLGVSQPTISRKAARYGISLIDDE